MPVLSRGGLALTALLAVLAIVGLWTGIGPLPARWLAAAALLALCWEGWRVRRAGLKLQLDGESRLFLGRITQPGLTLRAGRGRAWRARLDPRLPVALHGLDRPAVLRLEQQVRQPLQCRPVRLGLLSWPTQRLQVRGPLGLAWWPLRLATELEQRVLPEPQAACGQADSSPSASGRIRLRTGGGEELLSLRDWQPGDALAAIDWKATARRGRLVSRRFAEERSLELMIAIDCGRTAALACGSMRRLEHHANVAARLAAQAEANGDRTGLLLYADRPLLTLLPGRGRAATIRLMNALATAAPEPAEANPLEAALLLRARLPRRALVVLLTDLDEPTAGAPLTRALRLLEVRHATLVAGVTSDHVKNLAATRPQRIEGFWPQLAALEQRAATLANSRALSRLGARVVTAGPLQLDGAILRSYAGLRERGAA